MADKTTDKISPMADAPAPDTVQDIERPPMTDWQQVRCGNDSPHYISMIMVGGDLLTDGETIAGKLSKIKGKIDDD